MLFFAKSQPAPECLAHERTKPSGDYKCGDVLTRLQDDFKHKCYICEAQPTSINVEHFRPHKGDRDLMFDWNNLYWACTHCNNTKLAKYTDILDCTTDLKQLEAATLRAQLLQEIRDFQNQLCDYFAPTSDDAEKAYLRRKIKAHLHQASPFTSFKRWIIRGNDRLKQEFGEYI